jgi:hypothetical protein
MKQATIQEMKDILRAHTEEAIDIAPGVGDLRIQVWPTVDPQITAQIVLYYPGRGVNGKTLTARSKIAKRNLRYTHESIRFARV